ncbi:redox-sensing transcriptional repressor Rex [Halonatronum saccharophilum]|uniref:redox-sensing transcriptional repressor Rex n=1 Tax=Halonatronum saccharophilum TaxID=150060 RepID=UPI000483EFC1|nr:redox-sensing transcriptional repressor Rex [Halonatronum saccharophilum]
MKNIQIPSTTIERLPLYYRTLQNLRENGIEVISSKKLGYELGIPSTQVRKDLSYYGEFGKRGVGYEVELLMKNLERILGVNQSWEIALIGAGNLGRALVDYKGFRRLGLHIKYLFDIDNNKIGKKLGEAKIYDIGRMSELIKEKSIRIAIIAVPANVAQGIAEDLIDAGVKAIWNFAPAHLNLPKNIIVRDEDLSIGLISLTYHLSDK